MSAPRNRPRLPSSFTARARNVRRNYVEGVRNGDIPMPDKFDANGNRTAEARSLARLASLARWGRGPKAMRRYSSASGIRKTSEAIQAGR
jgi:hypothetical protein